MPADRKKKCKTCRGTGQVSVAPCTTGICMDCYVPPERCPCCKQLTRDLSAADVKRIKRLLAKETKA